MSHSRQSAVTTLRRPVVLGLMCLGLAALSCQQVPLAVPGAGDGGLRHAESATPRTEQPATGRVPSEPEARILAELGGRHTALSTAERVELARVIVEEARRHDLDPDLVMAVIHVESAGYHLAVSPVGALGLMQLLPSTGEELAARLGVAWHGPGSLFDPIVNVKLGTAYLRELSDRFDSMSTALAAYNWGPGRIHRRLRRGASVPSRYIEQVMKAYDARDAASTGRS